MTPSGAERGDDADAIAIASQRLPVMKPRSRSNAAVAIFRNEALGRGGEPEIDNVAEQQHPGPDIDVDAELEAAHPARQQHLGAKTSAALATRIRNTVPLRRCTRRCSALRMRALRRVQVSNSDGRCGTRAACSEPVTAKRASAGGGRGRTVEGGRPSKEPLTFGWKPDATIRRVAASRMAGVHRKWALLPFGGRRR